ncbi:hypothetical protein DFH08DRAFT_888994, partial [Mycena albidolilacea]
VEDELGIVYLVENAQQFWSELEDILGRGAHTVAPRRHLEEILGFMRSISRFSLFRARSICFPATWVPNSLAETNCVGAKPVKCSTSLR